jgi:heme A synthase
MINEQLCHELSLNPAFQLDENGGCSAESRTFHRIRESFHRVRGLDLGFGLQDLTFKP